MPHLSIRAVMMLAVSCLGVLLIASVGWRSYEAWRVYQHGAAIQKFDIGANRFVAGIFEILMERLATNNALQAPDPASPAVLNEIESRRRAVQQRFSPGLQSISSQEFAGREQLLATLQTALAKANEYRRQADQAIRLPRDQRDEALRKAYIPAITEMVNAALNVWFGALHSAAEADPTLSRLAVIKEIGWHMRDNAGKERSNLAQSIAGAVPITPDMQIANAATRARVDILWQQLVSLMPERVRPPAIQNAMESAQKEYFQTFRMAADQIKQASDAGAAYTMTAPQWVEMSTPQIGTLLDVMYAAGEASEAHVDRMLASARADMATSLALLIGGLLAIAGCFWLVVHRVSRPLAALSQAVQSLAHGDLAVIGEPDRHDHRLDTQYRPANQSFGPERNHRSGARWRGRTRVFRRRPGGEATRRSDGQGHR